MIRFVHGPEPEALVAERKVELPRVQAIAASRQITSSDIGTKYSVVRKHLYERAGRRCTFCENAPEKEYNDVEHFRPKAEVDRGDGVVSDGYWWLAWSWENLFFSCNVCNRSHKRTHFPLEGGSTPLESGRNPPGAEKPTLIDPAFEDPLDHIQFRVVASYWRPIGRSGSRRGQRTIEILGLDRQGLLDLYNDHVNTCVQPRIDMFNAALQRGDTTTIQEAWRHLTSNLTSPGMRFAGLTYDVIDQRVPLAIREQHGLELPRPGIALLRDVPRDEHVQQLGIPERTTG